MKKQEIKKLSKDEAMKNIEKLNETEIINEVKNKLVREKIESIYSLINNGVNYGSSNSSKIINWFDEKQL